VLEVLDLLPEGVELRVPDSFVFPVSGVGCAGPWSSTSDGGSGGGGDVLDFTDDVVQNSAAWFGNVGHCVVRGEGAFEQVGGVDLGRDGCLIVFSFGKVLNKDVGSDGGYWLVGAMAA